MVNEKITKINQKTAEGGRIGYWTPDTLGRLSRLVVGMILRIRADISSYRTLV